MCTIIRAILIINIIIFVIITASLCSVLLCSFSCLFASGLHRPMSTKWQQQQQQCGNERAGGFVLTTWEGTGCWVAAASILICGAYYDFNRPISLGMEPLSCTQWGSLLHAQHLPTYAWGKGIGRVDMLCIKMKYFNSAKQLEINNISEYLSILSQSSISQKI